MAKIAYTNKSTGDLVTAADMNEIKSTVNTNDDNNTGVNTGDETQATILTKIGYTPYNATNPAGYITLAAVTKSQVGLGNADNTSDANKPVSTLQAAADTAIATQLLDGVDVAGNTLKKLLTKIQSLESFVNGDDIDLDTIKELADAIKNEQSIIDALTANKVDIDDIANTLDIVIDGKVLDARQGKVLSDAIGTITTTVGLKANTSDVNTALAGKQNTLIAGEGITIVADEISAASTNASSTQFEVVGGVFQIKESWLTDFVNALIAGGLPTATDVAFTGTEQEGETLTGTYTYSGGTEGATTFKWYRSDDNTGTGKTAITGATAETYVLQAGDVGKFIQFAVTPKNSGGTAGTEVFSAYSDEIIAAGGGGLVNITSYQNTQNVSIVSNTITATADDSRAVSTDNFTRVIMQYDATWPSLGSPYMGLDKTNEAYPDNFFDYVIFVAINGRVYYKVRPTGGPTVQTDTGYSLPQTSTSYIGLRGDGTNMYIETSTDGAATWTIRATIPDDTLGVRFAKFFMENNMVALNVQGE